MDDDQADGFDVRRIQPYRALKVYRCPGCDHEIAIGLGHLVAVPLEAPADRRHWHDACWRYRDRRRLNPKTSGRPNRLGA